MVVEEKRRHELFELDKSEGKPDALSPNALLLGLSPADYLLKELRRVQPGQLEQALVTLALRTRPPRRCAPPCLARRPIAIARVMRARVQVVLPFSVVADLLRFFTLWLAANQSVELVAKCAIFLVQLHLNQLIATAAAAEVLDALRVELQRRLQQHRDVIGINRAALQLLQQDIADNTGVAITPAIPAAGSASKRRKPKPKP